MTYQRPFMPRLGVFAVLATLTCLFLVDCSLVQAGTFPAANSREVREIKAKIRASQFLSRATFGPTQKSIDALAARIQKVGYRRAVNEWIDNQFAMPVTCHDEVVRDIIVADGVATDEQGFGVSSYRYQAWWHIAIRAPDQLRQRVAWALAQIFVISDSGTGFNNDDKRHIGNQEYTVPDWMGMGEYYDMLGECSGGTYRQLLEDVTFHPNMGVYLSSLGNRKADVAAGRFPDENYAREIMQLFSIGLYELRQDGRPKTDANGNLIPTYDNEGIKELARVMTGFKYRTNYTGFPSSRNYGEPMVIDHRYHDNNKNYSEDPSAPESKTIFGVTLAPLASPLTDQACRAEVEEALDIIANHENVAPFICRLLIQRLVKSNPSRAYMRRVTRVFNNNGQGVRGHLPSVVKAIFTDPEMLRGQRIIRRRNPTRVDVIPRGTEYSTLREPVNRFVALIRACNPTTNDSDGFYMLGTGPQADLGQMPFRAPSVFNYYLPEYQPPGDLIGYVPSRRNPYGALFAPEFQILTGVTANRSINIFRRFCRDRYYQNTIRNSQTGRITLNLDEELELAKDLNNMDEILRRFDLLLCAGSLKEETKDSLKEAIETYTAGYDSRYEARLEEALLGVVLSADCAIQQ